MQKRGRVAFAVRRKRKVFLLKETQAVCTVTQAATIVSIHVTLNLTQILKVD